MLKPILVLLFFLAIDAAISYFIVNRLIKSTDGSSEKMFFKIVLFVLVFIIIAILSIYLISINFRFER